MAVDQGYFDKFDGVSDKYLPMRGEGETKATQRNPSLCSLSQSGVSGMHRMTATTSSVTSLPVVQKLRIP